MRFHALATDYDGTLAHDGRVDAPTLAALERAKAAGRKLLLVTGRELPDLQTVFAYLHLFDLAVLENGAVIFDPATKETRLLAEPPPPRFAAELRARGVAPLSTGHVIVATLSGYDGIVREVIHGFDVPLQVIHNKGSLMVLPAGVNKGTGLLAALEELGLAAENTVGVGDAENDHTLLHACGCGVAVANALEELKSAAQLVTEGKRGAGVAEVIDAMLADKLPTRPA
jgi:hydroxymethylpyrimidine pyrophosphatase-like HAD family hydrolase